LITGTSSGFGRLAVPLLLERGHTVVAGLRGGEPRLKEIFAQDAQGSGRLLGLDLHLEKEDSIAKAAEFVQERLGGRLDAVINNAGYGLFGALEDQTSEQLRYQFEVNFFGPVALTRALLPALRASRGRVINVSSICGLVSFPLYGAYCASKHALEAMTEGLAYDVKKFGVQCSLVEPGGFKTNFNARSKMWGDGSFSANSVYRERSEDLSRVFDQGTKKLGDPMRVARLLVRLCEKEKIPIRCVIGPDARFMALTRKFWPESLRFAFEDLLFRMAVFKGR
jgi:NAD(P)-dependent dehydrogenase (short-subunit alcohol dehydrogenase family)